MRILIIENNVTDEITLKQGVKLATDATQTIGLNLEFDFYTLNKQLTSLPFSNSTNLNGYYADPASFLGIWNIGYDATCCIFDSTKITPSPTNPMDSNISMSIPIQWYKTFPEVLRDYLLHELCHLFFAQQTTKPDITHYYDPAFAQKQRVEWYLYLLKDLTQNIMQTYKYFKLTESTGGGHTVAELKPELVQLLDTARGLANIPFIITSGMRTMPENASIGGKVNSAHLTGEAVDLACSDASSRWLMLNSLLKVGFDRLEVASRHIHADISKTLPQNVIDFSNDN